ncbi:hypothetical protein RGQ29_002124 [Quercus rubra]|uniref:Uncharacterized protein n=1 Tax=Quercus rubra TaxID=3512 RepID=A0AAN7JFE4_QUERU|nr:hypothetical protein RGQ29_002124 [Quercus rubra]
MESLYREAAEAAKEKINKAIADHFDIKTLSASLNSVCVADLGCSTRPNTFISVQNIIEAIKLQYISTGVHTEILEFMVFFNDHVSNDFNTLFKNLFILFNSSFALQWLSKAPIEVMDEGSPAWNKGRIFYTNAQKEVVEAYATQFAKDIDSFLFARAQELVVGGLLALFILAIPDVMSNSDTFIGTELDLLGSCLMDMAKVFSFELKILERKRTKSGRTMNVGSGSEAKVDAFNLPAYVTTPKELNALIERNQHFSFERMEILNNKSKYLTLCNPSMRSLFLRSAFEGVFEKHFGNDIMDELFNRYTEKVAESSFFLNAEADKSIVLFVLLKRNNY